MRIKVKTSHVASQYAVSPSNFILLFFFALTSMSSRDFPFFVRDDQRFVEIVFSKGWLCSRLQCSINICFRILTAGWNIVTKRNKRSWPFGFSVYVRADCLEAKLTPDGDHDVFRVPSCFEALFLPNLWSSLTKKAKIPERHACESKNIIWRRYGDETTKATWAGNPCRSAFTFILRQHFFNHLIFTRSYSVCEFQS